MDFKIGDEVLVEDGWNKFIDTITNITPKGFIRTKSGGYYDERGYQKSSSAWDNKRIVLLTTEKKEEMRKEKMIIDVMKKMHDIKNLSYEKAIKINDILES